VCFRCSGYTAVIISELSAWHPVTRQRVGYSTLNSTRRRSLRASSHTTAPLLVSSRTQINLRLFGLSAGNSPTCENFTESQLFNATFLTSLSNRRLGGPAVNIVLRWVMNHGYGATSKSGGLGTELTNTLNDKISLLILSKVTENIKALRVGYLRDR
jgi:hypothetical protein